MYFSAVCILSAFTVVANIYVLSLVSFDINLQKEMPKWVYFFIYFILNTQVIFFISLKN
jgi:hypothetical protein